MTISSSTIKTVLTSTLLASLAACSSGGGGGSKGAGPVKPNEAVKPGAAGAFEVTKTAPLGEYGQPPKEFDLPVRKQCEGVGTDAKSKSGFDARLTVGQKFREAYITATVDSTFGMTREATVKTLNGNTGTFETVISNINVIPHPGIVIPATLHANETCSYDEANHSSKCESQYTDGFNPPADSASPATTNCSTRSTDTSSVTGTVSLGTYTLASGAKVLAQKIERTEKIHIVCQKGNEAEQDLGEGTEISVRIESSDVVEHRFISCYSAGATLYSYRVLMTADGKTVSSSKTDLLAAPIAK